MSSVEDQNKKATEPIYELDVTETTPDLTDDTIYCSNLTFINAPRGIEQIFHRCVYRIILAL